MKLANPELDVWIITGDGDALSIGGNHTMHVLRRNLDCQILLFNNEIYGLTKGPIFADQPRRHALPVDAVRLGRPAGQPCAFALGSGARFVARAIDVHKNLPDVLKAAHAHKGAAFVEIFQNCIVYNDDVFAPFTDKAQCRQAALAEARRDRCCSTAAPRALTLDPERAQPQGGRRRRRRLGGRGRDRPRSEQPPARADADRLMPRWLLRWRSA